MSLKKTLFIQRQIIWLFHVKRPRRLVCRIQQEKETGNKRRRQERLHSGLWKYNQRGLEGWAVQQQTTCKCVSQKPQQRKWGSKGQVEPVNTSLYTPPGAVKKWSTLWSIWTCSYWNMRGSQLNTTSWMKGWRHLKHLKVPYDLHSGSNQKKKKSTTIVFLSCQKHDDPYLSPVNQQKRVFL